MSHCICPTGGLDFLKEHLRIARALPRHSTTLDTSARAVGPKLEIAAACLKRSESASTYPYDIWRRRDSSAYELLVEA